MVTIILLLMGLIFFVTTGSGFVILNGLLLGMLEVGGMLFSGLIGFIILGLVIGWILQSFNQRS